MRARVLPMSDDPVRTWVRTTVGWRSFQEFMIRQRAAGIVEGLEFRGAEQATPSAEVLAAIESARAIVIGPSNPLASIAPILAVPGIREALIAAPAPVVAVSPIVGGEVLKGPTAAFMAFAALECSADGVADFYGELLDGIVADENVARLPTLQIDTRMDDAAAREHVAGRCSTSRWPSRGSSSSRRGPALAPRLQRVERAVGDALEEGVAVVHVRQRLAGDVHLEELAQRLPAVGDLPDEQPLRRDASA